MVAKKAKKVNKCPTGKRRNTRTGKCQKYRKGAFIKSPATKKGKTGRKVQTRVVYVERKRRKGGKKRQSDPFHPYIRPGAYNADRDFGIKLGKKGLKLMKPTRCGGRYPHHCDSDANCEWNYYGNHCQARPLVHAGKRYQGPVNRV